MVLPDLVRLAGVCGVVLGSWLVGETGVRAGGRCGGCGEGPCLGDWAGGCAGGTSASRWLGWRGVLLQGGRLQPADCHGVFPFSELKAEELVLPRQDPVRPVITCRQWGSVSVPPDEHHWAGAEVLGDVCWTWLGWLVVLCHGGLELGHCPFQVLQEGARCQVACRWSPELAWEVELGPVDQFGRRCIDVIFVGGVDP